MLSLIICREVFSDVDASYDGGNLGRQSENFRSCQPLFCTLPVSCVSCCMAM